jgi:hypothetical protein
MRSSVDCGNHEKSKHQHKEKVTKQRESKQESAPSGIVESHGERQFLGGICVAS